MTFFQVYVITIVVATTLQWVVHAFLFMSWRNKYHLGKSLMFFGLTVFGLYRLTEMVQHALHANGTTDPFYPSSIIAGCWTLVAVGITVQSWNLFIEPSRTP